MHDFEETGYLYMSSDILDFGNWRKPEGEEGRWELFDYGLSFDLSGGHVPFLTTKKMPIKAPIVEMLWFISGSQRIDYLLENDVHIWSTWAGENNVVGPLYGYQWRHWHIDPALRHLHGGATEIDQLANVMQTLRDRPEARSHMITAWRPDHLKAMSIKPCHILMQFYRHGDEISMSLFQRSCDTFLGVPFNLAQYSVLLHMIAHQLDYRAGWFNWHGMDVHIYENHEEQIREQLQQPIKDPPKINFRRKPPSIDDYRLEDIEIVDYEHGPRLKGDISPQGTPGQATEV